MTAPGTRGRGRVSSLVALGEFDSVNSHSDNTNV